MKRLLLTIAVVAMPTPVFVQSTVVSSPPWGACISGTQTKVETVTTPTVASNGSVTSTTQSRTATRACTVTTPPTPVNCVVSTYALAGMVLSACVNGTQTRTETWTRTILTQPANGGTACPSLIDIRTFTQSCSTTPPPPPTGAGIVLRDNFDYVVSRTDLNAANVFVNQNVGWTHVKTQQNASGAHGYLYTTNTIPGFTGQFPGGGPRVLAMEALPSQLGGQTDFYLGMGNGGLATFDNYIPGDVWIQFWIYVLRDATHPSSFGTRDKFLYPCNGDYGCHTHKWMVMADSATYRGATEAAMWPRGNPSLGEFFWVTRQSDGVSELINTTGDPDQPGNIGPQSITEWVRPNRWTLVKMHFNTTRTTGNSWEVWLKPQGSTLVTKVAEWIGGVTPGFTWNIPAASVGGHRVMRMPSTVDHDFWIYMDDFVIARTEAALPVYQ